jgi:KUP system potassium uptake protein
MARSRRRSPCSARSKAFLSRLERDRIARVPDTAVFLTRALRDTPPVLVWHVQHNRALHSHVLAITARVESVPWIAEADRVSVSPMAPGFWRVVARYGFIWSDPTSRG